MDMSLLANISGEWLEATYSAWKRNSKSVSLGWQTFFSGFELASDNAIYSGLTNQTHALKQSGVQSLIYRYRNVGHLLACTDPLSPCLLQHPLLALSCFGLDENDLDKSFACRRFMKSTATLREVLSVMLETYCREIGVEFMHIQEPDERQWFINEMESCGNRPKLNVSEKLHVLEKLHQATQFESFLHRRFIGQKRFSLEGGEILVPVLDRVVRNCPVMGIGDIVMGMSHRGRLNVLAHIFNKPYELIIAEFQDTAAFGFVGDGDVKYHKGYSTDIEINGHQIHITLAANPSHLEAVNSVVLGKCRARQDSYGDGESLRVLPVLIHGDAAFSGQGSVMEVLNLSQLEGYGTGGTIHIVLNNQIGFTTIPEDSRSTHYATDVAKMLSCPIFHVQGESPESALHVVDLAMKYRSLYRRDVVIELICYRRHGHNEGDEPAFTQPLMYKQIYGRPPLNHIYAELLKQEGVLSQDVHDAIELKISKSLDSAFEKHPETCNVGFSSKWQNIDANYSMESIQTGVSAETILTAARKLAELPPGFSPHPKISNLIQKRFEALLKGYGIDWGNAETMAYATLLGQGVPVRISGQDSRRGTFNHRHCVIVDNNDETTYIPLEKLSRKNAYFQVWNSPLSEFGVLGFEYGYSLETPFALTIWEAQFGDFANGAQVIIDQFIASGETKWNRASGLVMLLPHGYEGQGGEHSSARIERFLQLCAQENMVVVCPSTPSQLFHLLRRQVLQPFRKPLIVFTPKSLLRHPRCTSTVDEFTAGYFKNVITDFVDVSNSEKILFCSGKLYYELLDERERLGVTNVAIIRIEQLYPLSFSEILSIVDQCPDNCLLLWVQEEPQNMGAWQFIGSQFEANSLSISYIGRMPDASPAVGSHHLHMEQQTDIVKRAFSC